MKTSHISYILFILISKTLNNCVAGEFTDKSAYNACKQCAEGTYSDETSAVVPAAACTDCLAGT